MNYQPSNIKAPGLVQVPILSLTQLFSTDATQLVARIVWYTRHGAEEDSEYFSNYLWLFRTRMPMLRRQDLL
jgi:hypothetical protein